MEKQIIALTEAAWVEVENWDNGKDISVKRAEILEAAKTLLAKIVKPSKAEKKVMNGFNSAIWNLKHCD